MNLSAQDIPNFPNTAKGQCELMSYAYKNLFGADAARSVEVFLLSYGEEFGKATLPDYLTAMAPRMCFQNCFELAELEDDLTYCEGYILRPGVFPLVVHHAWLVDTDDSVIEPTITDDPLGLDYFGVRLPFETVDAVTRVTNSYSVLGKPEGHEAIEDLYGKREEER